MRSLKYIFVPVFLALFSCMSDEPGVPAPEPDGEGWVTLALELPGTSSTGTRAPGVWDESCVEIIEVLLFEPGGDYVTTAITNSVTDEGYIKTCRLLMPAGTFDMLILANSARWLDHSFPYGIAEGTPRETIERGLVFEMDGGMWNTDPASADFSGWLPMWGDKNSVTVSQGTTISGIRLLRAVARVDVELGPGAATDMVLRKVHIQRAYTKGRIVPDKSTNWNAADGKVTAPTFPASVSVATAPGSTDAVTAGEYCYGAIYIPETPAGVPLTGSTDNNVSLILEGSYSGSEGNFYRLDLASRGSEGWEYIPLMRNYRYKVEVTGIDRSGYSSLSEAMTNRPANIIYEINTINESGMNTIVWNGQHQLVVTTDTLKYYAGGNTQKFRIYTDHPSGWSISGAPSWLGASATSGNPSQAGTPDEILLTADALSDPTTGRNSTFRLAAGDMDIIIQVVQTTEIELFVEADPDYIIFYGDPQEQVVTITTSPPGAHRTYTYSGTIVWDDNGFPADGTSGTIRLLPKNNTSNSILAGIVTVSVQDDDGNIATTDITVRQFAQNNPFTIVTFSPYPAYYQSNAEFTIISTVDWHIKRSVPEGAVELVNSGIQPAAVLPTEYEFTLQKNNSFNEREIVVTFASDDGYVEHDEVFVQAGVVPSLMFYNPNPVEYDLHFTGSEPHTANIGMEVNFPWRYTVESDYNDVIAATNYMANTKYDIPNYTVGESVQLQLSRYPYENGTGMPVAGTELTSKMYIWNVDTDPYASTIMGTINIRRTIEARWDLLNISHSPSQYIIPRTGGTINVMAGSNANWKLTTSTGQSYEYIPASVYGQTSIDVVIPESEEIFPREAHFYYEIDGVPTLFAPFEQQGYVFTVTDMENRKEPKNYYLGTGDSVRVQVSGDHPNLKVRLNTDNDGEVYSTSFAKGTATEEKYLQLPHNTVKYHRNVDIEYSYDDGATWNNVSSFRQMPGFYLITTTSYYERFAATADAGAFDWSEAMGIMDYFNTSTFYNTYGTNQDRENPRYSSTHGTGCNLYSEGEYTAGWWRLATSAQMQTMMAYQRYGIYEFNLVTDQWYNTAYDNGLNRTRRVRLNSDGTIDLDDNGDKTTPALTRCVVNYR